MPNWCNNQLTIPDLDIPISEVLEKYLTKIGNEIILDFEKIIPFPKCIKESVKLWDFSISPETNGSDDRHSLIEKAEENNLKECGYKSWYDWSVAHWGTKWNCSDAVVTDDCISFCTAWAPPCAVIQKLAELVGEKLRMTYIEEGCGFCGELIANPDGTSTDFCRDIPEAPQSLLDELGYEPWEGEELEEID